MSGFQRMVGRRRWKASAAPSLVMTQSSLSQSMMVRSKSKTTTTAGTDADAMGRWAADGKGEEDEVRQDSRVRGSSFAPWTAGWACGALPPAGAVPVSCPLLSALYM
jgi:hypothetical protein